MNVLFVIDPLAGLQPEVDATVGLMAAAQGLGAAVWWCGPEDLALVEGRLRARANQIRIRPRGRGGDHRWLVEPVWWDDLETSVLDVAESFELVQLRIDPPVDSRYLHTTYLLDAAEAAGVRVTNRPSGVRELHEKIAALRWPQLCPATTVSAAVPELRDFVAEHGTVVVKPVDGFAGGDVWLVRNDAAAASLLESATAGGHRHVIVQAYLPDVERGNKRLFLLDGEVIGAVLRRPAADDFRIGPPVAAAAVDADDERIVAAVGPDLVRHGLAVAGIDVIDGRLIEINLTCPGGMAKTDALLGTDLSGTIMRRLLSPRSSRSVPSHTERLLA
ncbi:glutathione synthase [Marmoricola sp. URHA0025 HA25]